LTDKALREIASGLSFPEGPVALADGSILLVEIAAGRLTRIAPDGSKSTIAEMGGGPNGAAIGPDGKVYVCNNGGFRWHDLPGVGRVPAGQAGWRSAQNPAWKEPGQIRSDLIPASQTSHPSSRKPSHRRGYPGPREASRNLPREVPDRSAARAGARIAQGNPWPE
jgi:SMP-30/Gluconolactonase/LRE-like region